jgi:hypothetical protein
MAASKAKPAAAPVIMVASRHPMSMDQTGQKQKARRANRVKPRPNDGERPGKFLSIATGSA